MEERCRYTAHIPHTAASRTISGRTRYQFCQIVRVLITTLITHFYNQWGTLYSSWLRNYATSRKVAGSIRDEVIGFFSLPNSSSRNMAPESTQPLTQMSTRNLPERLNVAGV
jgi:hypothetical protein